MSLAHKLEQVATAVASVQLPQREQGRAGDGDKVSLLRRAQGESRAAYLLSMPPERGASDAVVPSVEPRKASESQSHRSAINLIDEVSSLIPVLVEENDTLRAVLKRERDRLEADVERATLVACEWRKSAESAKQQVELLERKLAETTARLDRAEVQVQSEKERAGRAARDAAEAECLSSLFEEKLLSSFGAGSPFQATLDRIRQRGDVDAA